MSERKHAERAQRLEAEGEHITHAHVGHLPEGFVRAADVTEHQVHHLLHRLFKWKMWKHTPRDTNDHGGWADLDPEHVHNDICDPQ